MIKSKHNKISLIKKSSNFFKEDSQPLEILFLHLEEISRLSFLKGTLGLGFRF